MLLLNKKSATKCSEEEFSKHSDEIDKIFMKLIELENYDCKVIHSHIDIANKDKEIKVLDSKIWNIYEDIEYVDFKNGVDALLDNEGFLNLSVYGQGYKMGGENHFLNSLFKIIPQDKEGNVLDISEFILEGSKVRPIKKETASKLKSTIDILNDYKEKVKSLDNDKGNNKNKSKEGKNKKEVTR